MVKLQNRNKKFKIIFDIIETFTIFVIYLKETEKLLKRKDNEKQYLAY